MVNDITFDYPQSFFLLLLLFPLAFFLWNQMKREKKVFAIFKDTSLPPKSFYSKPLFLFLTCLFAVLALAGPKGNPRYTDQSESLQVSARPHLVFLLDTSFSMTAADAPSKETRFQAAKELIETLLLHFKGAYVSLYTFGNDLDKLIPKTMDTVFFRLFLNQITLDKKNPEGTDFRAALESFKTDNADIPNPKTLILISDGDDTSLLGLDGRQKLERLSEIAEPASGLSLFTVGVGSEKGFELPGVQYEGKPVDTRLNSELLKKIGLYFPLDQDPKKLIEGIERQKTQEGSESSKGSSGLVYSYYFQWPLSLAIVFLILFLFSKRTALSAAVFFFTTLFANEETELHFYRELKDTQGITRVLDSIDPKNEWQKGAIAIDQAIAQFESDFKEGFLELSSAELAEDSFPYALFVYHFWQGQFFLKYADSTDNPILKQFFLKLSEHFFRQSEKEYCAFLKEKGYETCAFELPEIKKVEEIAQSLSFEADDDTSKRSRIAHLLKQNPLKTADIDSAKLKEELFEIYNLISENNQWEARFLLLHHYMNFLPKLDSGRDPKQILKDAIERQNFAFILNFSGDQNLALDAQTISLNALKPFLTASFKAQEKAFFKNGCLDIPWEKIYPPFQKSIALQKHALSLIKNKEPGSIHYQWSAIMALNEALSEFQNERERNESDASQSETYRTFQDLELMDKPFEWVIPTEEKVQRPW